MNRVHEFHAPDTNPEQLAQALPQWSYQPFSPDRATTVVVAAATD
jgi:hypothetical protein